MPWLYSIVLVSFFAFADHVPYKKVPAREICRSLLGIPVNNPSSDLESAIEKIPDYPVADENNSILRIVIAPPRGGPSPVEFIKQAALELGVTLPESLSVKQGGAFHLTAVAPPAVLKAFLARLADHTPWAAGTSASLVVSASSGALPPMEPGSRLIHFDESHFAAALSRIVGEDPEEIRIINISNFGYFFARVPAQLLAVYDKVQRRREPGGEKTISRLNLHGFLEPVRRHSDTDKPFDRFRELIQPVVAGRARLMLMSQNQERFALISLSDLVSFQRLRTLDSQNLFYPHRTVPQTHVVRILECAGCDKKREVVTPTASPVSTGAPKASAPRVSEGRIGANGRRETRTAPIYARWRRVLTKGDPLEVSEDQPPLTVVRYGQPYVVMMAARTLQTLAEDQLEELLAPAAGRVLSADIRAQLAAYRADRSTSERVPLMEFRPDTGPRLFERTSITIVTDDKNEKEDRLVLIPVNG